MKAPKIIFEHTTAEEISGDIVDGMALLMGDDVTGSEYEAGTPWPGVPKTALPPWFNMPDGAWKN